MVSFRYCVLFLFLVFLHQPAVSFFELNSSNASVTISDVDWNDSFFDGEYIFFDKYIDGCGIRTRDKLNLIKRLKPLD
jgi:hypothetical protein